MQISTVCLITLLASSVPLEALAEPTRNPSHEQADEGEAIVPAGTHVPLVMINSVSTKASRPGDPVYLQSRYPVAVGERILIPAGSNVSGSVTFTRNPGRIKGRALLGVRLEQIILPNGVIRSLVGQFGALDGRSREGLDRETGTIRSPAEKGENAETIATSTAIGASVGVLVGRGGGSAVKGLGVGAGVGAAAGLASVLSRRGSHSYLDRGTHVEMVLLEELAFSDEEVRFSDPVGQVRDPVGDRPEVFEDRRRRPRGISRIPGIGRPRLPRPGRL